MKETDDIRYGIDKIEFLSKHPVQIVQADLYPIRGKWGIPKSIGVVKVYELKNKGRDKKYYSDGYRSKIILTKFTEELLTRLEPVDFLFNRPNLIEIFQDISGKTENEVIKQTKWRILHLHMVYCHGGCKPHLIKSGRPETLYREKATQRFTETQLWERYWKSVPKIYDKKDGCYKIKNDPTIIGDRTLYLGQGDLEFKIYARLSKTDELPVVHSEFSLIGYDRMQKLGILNSKKGNLEAIRKKVMLRVSQHYTNLADRRLRLNRINEEKVAKHFLGLSKVKQPDENQRKQIRESLRTLKRIYSLDTTASYMQFFYDNGLDSRRFITCMS